MGGGAFAFLISVGTGARESSELREVDLGLGMQEVSVEIGAREIRDLIEPREDGWDLGMQEVSVGTLGVL